MIRKSTRRNVNFIADKSLCRKPRNDVAVVTFQRKSVSAKDCYVSLFSSNQVFKPSCNIIFKRVAGKNERYYFPGTFIFDDDGRIYVNKFSAVVSCRLNLLRCNSVVFKCGGTAAVFVRGNGADAYVFVCCKFSKKIVDVTRLRIKRRKDAASVICNADGTFCRRKKFFCIRRNGKFLRCG